MTIRDLLYAVTIFDEGSFSAAAQKLFISQSALSQAIRKLEKELDMDLFVRNGIRLQPTNACGVFVRHAREVLLGWNTFESEMRTFSESRKTELCVGMPSGLQKNLLPYVMSFFSTHYPENRISVIEERSNTVEELALKDLVDLGIVQEPLLFPEIGHIPCFESELLLAVPRNHPFTKKHPYRGLMDLEQVDLRELSDTSFSIMKHQRVDYLIEKVFNEAGFSPLIHKKSSVWNNVKEYIKMGTSAGFIDEVFAQYEPDEDKIAYYRLKGIRAVRNMYAVFCPGKQLSQNALHFIDAVKQYPRLP